MRGELRKKIREKQTHEGYDERGGSIMLMQKHEKVKGNMGELRSQIRTLFAGDIPLSLNLRLLMTRATPETSSTRASGRRVRFNN